MKTATKKFNEKEASYINLDAKFLNETFEEASERFFKIDKKWNNPEDLYNSEEVAEIYDFYEYELSRIKRLMNKWISEGTFKFLGGYKIGDNVYTHMQTKEGYMVFQKVEIGCCIHNGGLMTMSVLDFNGLNMVKIYKLPDNKCYKKCDQNFKHWAKHEFTVIDAGEAYSM
jgi:hypothetical protein